MNSDYFTLQKRFRKVFETRWERSELENFDELREKFAFHMADVHQHLSELADIYDRRQECDEACVADRVEMFFLHCMPHLVAAANIFDEIPQRFDEQNGVHDWSDNTPVAETPLT